MSLLKFGHKLYNELNEGIMYQLTTIRELPDKEFAIFNLKLKDH